MQPPVARRAEPEQLDELTAGRLADPAQDLASAEPGGGRQAAHGSRRVPEPARVHPDGVDQRGRGERPALRVEHLCPRGHGVQHGEAESGPQPGHDDRRAPHHLPAAAHPAQREPPLVGPGRAAAAEVDGRVESGLGRVAVLRYMTHRDSEIGRAQLPVGRVQRRGHRHWVAGRLGGSRGVPAALPVEQEGLHRRLGRGCGLCPAEPHAEQQQRGRAGRGHHPGPRPARANPTHPCFPDSSLTRPAHPARLAGPGSDGPGPPGRSTPPARQRSRLAGVCAAAMRAGHGPALRYLRRRRARSTSLAASLRARS